MHFTTLQNEGSLIPADLLAEIYAGEAIGQKPNDFGLTPKSRLTDEMAAHWSTVRASWQSFQSKLNRIDKEDAATSVTREHWVTPLLRQLGFDGLQYCRTAAAVDGRNYPISHRLGDKDSGLPVHIEGAHVELGKRPANARHHFSPHALLQEYLNRTDHLWGMVTNGYQLRILRDAARMSRPTFLEFNLRQMLEAEQFAEFQLLYRIVHRSRWPQTFATATECWLEKYFLHGIESGSRVREKLRTGVEEALKIFGTGFLSHPGNAALRRRIAENQLEASQLYRQLLRLIYRFLFLMVAEERKMVGVIEGNDLHRWIYENYYSISSLREKVERPINPQDRHWDLWERVKQTFRLYSFEDEGKRLGIAALNGALFGLETLPDLEEALLLNRDFLRGFAHLSLFRDDKITRRINYAHLDVEELGSVYESLLDFHPVIRKENGGLSFELVAGSDRKSTGSYYTRPELVQELIKSALEPVMNEKLSQAKTAAAKEKALLDLKCCDPAAGSGHFLLAAARRLGKELARVRSGEEEPAPEEFRLAVRHVIQSCIYGVDLNPLAVDLCKVALWVEGHNPGLPLTFLDHRIKSGNSLVGVMDLQVLTQGIPDGAFKPVTGDDKKVATALRQRNKKERLEWLSGQERLNFDEPLQADSRYFAEAWRELAKIAEHRTDDIKTKAQLYEKLRQKGENWYRDWTACNLWTYAFFSPLQDKNDKTIPTSERLHRFLENSEAVSQTLVETVNEAAFQHNFFHWPLEFPEVMRIGGFDIVLGNPPWEQTELKEKEWFKLKLPEIVNATSAAARKRMIAELKRSDSELYDGYLASRQRAVQNALFLNESGRYPFCGRGRINKYAVFAETMNQLVGRRGRTGCIVPSGIATTETTKEFFQHLLFKNALVSFLDFSNKNNLFQGVERNIRFSLLTISAVPQNVFRVSGQMESVANLTEKLLSYEMSHKRIALINPNTLTCPTFQTAMDAELVEKIYTNVPVLKYEGPNNKNSWSVDIRQGLFNSTSQSGLFKNREELSEQKHRLEGNIFRINDELYLPLYEAKLIHQYNHRATTYDGIPKARRFKIHAGTNTSSVADLSDPNYVPIPRFWISERFVSRRIKRTTKWMIGLRLAISAVADSRSLIACILPAYGVANSIPLLLPNIDNEYHCILLAALNSFVLDYTLRQKISSGNLNHYIIKQLPIHETAMFTTREKSFILPRVIELTYTSWDLVHFAKDLKYNGKPFRWDEDRRAVLRAELDAYYAKLYGLTRDELRYILDPQDVYGPDFPGETFRVLKAKEIKKYGEYRTRRLVLEAWDRLGFGK